MKQVLIRAGLIVSLATSCGAAWATVPDLESRLQASISAGDTFQQRKDVDEVTRPPPPSGPTSQTIVCSPSMPDCP